MFSPPDRSDTCPRCHGSLTDPLLDSDAQLYGPSYVTEDPAALCAECRLDELWRHHADARYVPPTEWPITDGPHDYLLTSKTDLGRGV